MLKVMPMEGSESVGGASSRFDILAQEILGQGLCLRVKGHGHSMYPFMQDDDTLLIEPKSVAELNVGDIIFFRRPQGSYVVHRLIRKNGSATLLTRGDNSPNYDEPVPVGRVLGRVVQIVARDRQASLKGGMSRVVSLILAWLGRGRGSTRTRLRRNLGRLWWLIEGRPVK